MADGRYPYADRFLSAIWGALGGDPKTIEDVTFSGDAVLPACYAMTDLGAASLAAAGAATAELVATTGVSQPSVHVDRTRGTAWFAARPNRSASGRPDLAVRSATSRPTTRPPTVDFIRFQANYEHLRDAILAVLDVPEDKDAIAAVISEHDADEIETAIVNGGGAASASRSVEEWATHPQGSAVNAEPLIDVTTTARVADRWQPTPERPLAGIRVLDVTRVLAVRWARGFSPGTAPR